MRSFVTLAVAAAMMAGSVWAQEQSPPAVDVITVESRSVTLTATLPGRVSALAEAEVRPQVNGIIEERLFTEGTRVAEGDLLYRIDPVRYEAAVAQAQAQVSQAEAQARSAERDYDRITELQSRGVSSKTAEDDALSAREIAEAQLAVAQAQLESAQIELDHTEIRAKLSGLIGLSQASQGALVTASQVNPLAVIRAIDPVYVDVTQSAADLLAWQRGEGRAEKAGTKVELILADGSRYSETGTLTAAETQVDEQTGVITLRMSFANPNELLLPGMYVQVELPTQSVDNVFLIPQEAVNRDRRGQPFALAVNADNVVEQRPLKIIQDRGSDWIVESGLEAGERIIVAGFQKTSPGATVTPEARDQGAPASGN